MITATCNNDACRWHDIERTVLGAPLEVMCGGCRTACTISDERDDPPAPDELID